MVTKGYQQLMDDANARVITRTVAEAIALVHDDNYAFIDIRDRNELEDEGMVPGAFHSPRGSLEFWTDPGCPAFAPIYGDTSKHLILYCAGSWRSALATAMLQEQGYTNISHISGGFNAWKKASGPVTNFQRSE